MTWQGEHNNLGCKFSQSLRRKCLQLGSKEALGLLLHSWHYWALVGQTAAPNRRLGLWGHARRLQEGNVGYNKHSILFTKGGYSLHLLRPLHCLLQVCMKEHTPEGQKLWAGDHNLSTVWPWSQGLFNSLILSFLICKVEVIWYSTCEKPLNPVKWQMVLTIFVVPKQMQKHKWK